MRGLLLILIFGGLVACEKGPLLGPGNADYLASAAQSDCGFLQNAYGERVSWKNNIPVQLNIHKDYPEEFIKTLESAAKHWNDAAGMTLFLFKRDDNMASTSATKDNQNTIHWMKEWPDTSNNQQGVTNLFWRGNKLYETDIAINNKYFTFYTESYSTVYQVHLESLLIHELGHVLGLKHRSTLPSVMWAVLSGGTVRNVLTDADRESLKCEY